MVAIRILAVVVLLWLGGAVYWRLAGRRLASWRQLERELRRRRG